MKHLHLVVPGLLGPFANDLPAHIQSQLKIPEFELINKVLARAEQAKISFVAEENQLNRDSYFQTLVQLINPKCELSLCQLMAHFDGIDVSEGYFYRADPVHFKAESDHAILIGPSLLEPSLSETEQLIASFNQHFYEDKLSLHSNDASRWYLKSERPLKLSFNALDYALGRDIKHFLPQGEDEIWWRKNLNEAQMLFFQHEVSLKRESAGKLAINGLWLWDLSSRLNGLKILSPTQLFCDNAVATALGRQIGVDIQSIDDLNEIDSIALVVLDYLYDPVCYGDMDAWLTDLTQFCKTDFQRFMTLLSSKNIDELSIYPCNGKVFNINKARLLKFWKQGSIEQYIDKDFTDA